MGDTGASGVVGVFFIIGIFAIAIILGLVFATFSFSKSSKFKSVSLWIIGILLAPPLIFCGWIVYETTKASIEVKIHRAQDEQRAKQQKAAEQGAAANP